MVEREPTADGKSDKIFVAAVAVIAGTLFLFLALIAWWFVNEHSARIKFLTVNTLSLLVLVVIAIQAYIYRRQWRAMQESLVETRKMVEALSAGERAYLMIEDMQLAPMQVGANWAVTATIVNRGRTPAWSLETASQAFIARDLPTDIPRLGGFEKRELIIPAGTKRQIEFVFDIPITDGDRQQINSGTLTLVADGEIRYRDFQHQIWRLPFFVSFDPNRRRFKDHKANTYMEPTV